MTPKQLRYFICTAEEGSFAAASRVLFIAQPSLSQQIANLEAELGVEVFLRQARGVLLTEAGEKLLEHAHAILRQIDAASADVSSTADNPQGTVKLGLTQSICNLLPLYLVEAAAKSYPGIEMDITAGLSSNLQQWLREGAIDIAVYPDLEPDTNEFKRQALIREPLYFVTSKPAGKLPLRGRGKHRHIRFHDLTAFQFILPSSSRDVHGSLVKRYETETGIALKKRPGLGQLMSNISFVLTGECECLLPWNAIHHLVDSGLVTAALVVEPEMRRDIFIHTDRNRPLTAAMGKSIELIEDCTRQAHAQNKWKGELLYSAHEVSAQQ
jgi:LysR family nitrogen assimilation transcriptional regulator